MALPYPSWARGRGLVNYAALRRETGRSDEAAKMEARAEAIRAKHAKENPAK